MIIFIYSCHFLSCLKELQANDLYYFNQIASEGLKHRVFEVSLADLQGDEDHAFRKIRLRAEDVQGRNVLTNFWIRRKMREIMVNQAQSCDLKDLVQKFIPESIGRDIEKATSSIYPLQNVFIRKVKILKAPKFDLGKLMEVHGDYSEDVGVKVDRAADEPIAEAAEPVGA
nr:40S ribosomal protein S3a-like [Ipomoea batatas]